MSYLHQHDFFQILHTKVIKLSTYSNTSQTCGPKLAKFSNSRFLSLLFTSKLAVPFTSIQIRELAIFRAPKFASLEVLLYIPVILQRKKIWLKLINSKELKALLSKTREFWMKNDIISSPFLILKIYFKDLFWKYILSILKQHPSNLQILISDYVKMPMWLY